MRLNKMSLSVVFFGVLLVVQSIYILFFKENFIPLLVSDVCFISFFVVSYRYQAKISAIQKMTLNDKIKEFEQLNRDFEMYRDERKIVENESKELIAGMESKSGDLAGQLNFELVFYKEAIRNLIESISVNLSVTTTPISTDLLNIQEHIVNFLKNIAQYEDEIVNQTSFKQISKKADDIRLSTELVLKTVNNTFKSFNDNIKLFESITNKIFESAKEIDNIASQINVLSINAAIESARAGNDGKGFRVISEEIKKLSGHTVSFLKDINLTIAESKRVLSSINIDFQTREDNIVNSVTDQLRSSNEAGDIFSRYSKNFETIYEQIQAFIQTVRVKVGNISPVVQLHEITIQEAGNLELVIDDFITDSLDKLKYIQPNQASGSNSRVSETSGRIRSRLTTSRELDALEKTLSKLNYEGHVDLKRENTKIELF